MKIWIIVGLAALVSAGAQAAGLTTLSLGAVVGVIEFILIQLLMRSWGAVTWAGWLPRPAWARMDLTGEWHGTIQSQWKKNPHDALLPPIPTRLELHQSWKDVVFALFTDKMDSRSSAAAPFYDESSREL